MDRKKLITFLLALTMILSLSMGASAAETTEARVPVTLTVVNTVSPISCTVPAALPVSLVDGYVVCANNAAITNTAKTGSAAGTVQEMGETVLTTVSVTGTRASVVSAADAPTLSDRIIVSANSKVISFFLSITAPPSARGMRYGASTPSVRNRSACRRETP